MREYAITGSAPNNKIIIENSNKTIILQGLTASDCKLANSDINIVIDGSNSLVAVTSGAAGIECTSGSKLQISSKNNNKSSISNIIDSLTVVGETNAAGIGLARDGGYCKSIIINDGVTLDARTSGSGAVIGGAGSTTSTEEIIDEIIINGGDLTLSNGRSAGIGSYSKTVMKNITINGGKIQITASRAPAIGGGKSIENININGGNITINNGNGPGIRTITESTLNTIHITNGELNIVSQQTCIGSFHNGRNPIKRIIIDNGKIIAKENPSGNCAAIGGGSSMDSGVDLIEINGGVIECESGKGAGIGSGESSTIGTIQINGGVIKCRSGVSGAGIGAGTGSSSGLNENYIGLINITGGNIHATGTYGAGIGAGKGMAKSAGVPTDYITNQSSVGRIEIWGGKIVAKSDNSAGIGGGYGETLGSSTVEEIFIAGGTIESEGVVGIGASHSINSNKKAGDVNRIIIKEGTIVAKGEISGIGGGNETSVQNIIIEGGNIKCIGKSNGAGIGGGYNTEIGFINITGGEIEATVEDNGPGIGCSCVTQNCHSSIEMITILKGQVNSIGKGNSAGIGGGEALDSNSVSIGHIYINGSIIHGNGGESGSGIGGGLKSSVEQITLGAGSDFVEIIGIGGINSNAGISAGGTDEGNIDKVTLIGGMLKCDQATKECQFKKTYQPEPPSEGDITSTSSELENDQIISTSESDSHIISTAPESQFDVSLSEPNNEQNLTISESDSEQISTALDFKSDPISPSTEPEDNLIPSTDELGNDESEISFEINNDQLSSISESEYNTPTEHVTEELPEIISKIPTDVHTPIPTEVPTPETNETSDKLTVECMTTNSNEIIITKDGYRDKNNTQIKLNKEAGTITLIETTEQNISLSGKEKPEAEFYISASQPNTFINIDVDNSDISVVEFGIHANDKSPIVYLPEKVVDIPLNLMTTSNNSLIVINSSNSSTLSINKVTANKGSIEITISQSVDEFIIKNIMIYLKSKITMWHNQEKSSIFLEDEKDIEITSNEIIIYKGGSLELSNINVENKLEFKDVSNLTITKKIVFNEKSIINIQRKQNINNTYLTLSKEATFTGKPKMIEITLNDDLEISEFSDFNIICGLTSSQCKGLTTLFDKNDENVYKYGKCLQNEDTICLVASSTKPENDSGKLTIAQIVGIIIGCIAAGVIIIIIISCFKRKKKRKSWDKKMNNSDVSYSSDLLESDDGMSADLI